MFRAKTSAALCAITMVLFCSIADGYDDQVVVTMKPQQATLLDQLRQEWQEQRSTASSRSSDFPRPEPSALVGVVRAGVTLKLGAPDFCLPNPDSCSNSPRWTYFFYRFQPPSVRSAGPGIEEIKIVRGGGWALELVFSQDGAIEKASWVKQE
jgi:hypothetical protein